MLLQAFEGGEELVVGSIRSGLSSADRALTCSLQDVCPPAKRAAMRITMSRTLPTNVRQIGSTDRNGT
jgi:hypothetical protein